MVMSKNSGSARGLGVADLRLCLDFANTEGVVRNGPPDRLDELDLFLAWAVDRGLADAAAARRFASGPAPGFLDRARALREALYRIFAARIGHEAPAAGDLARLERELAETLSGLRFVASGGDFRWTLAGPPQRPDDLLRPIAASAADLLVSDQLDRLKECSSQTCSWLFLDESRNHSRRWCDMADCGNRAKARRFYRRHAHAEAADASGE